MFVKINFNFLFKKFCHVLSVVCFLLDNSPASKFYMQIKFRSRGITQKKAYNKFVICFPSKFSEKTQVKNGCSRWSRNPKHNSQFINNSHKNKKTNTNTSGDKLF